MKLTVHFTSQGRLLEGSLYLPDNLVGLAPTLLFEGSVTGTNNQVMDRLASDLSQQGLVCLIMDHSYFGEDEKAPQPWESPTKRLEDLKAALSFLNSHAAVDKEKIVGVGVSVGAEFMAEVCRATGVCKGLVMVQGPFDDTQNLVHDLDIPSLVVNEDQLDTTVDEIVIWVRTLFASSVLSGTQGLRPDWSSLDK